MLCYGLAPGKIFDESQVFLKELLTLILVYIF